jgi:hypothetical protein
MRFSYPQWSARRITNRCNGSESPSAKAGYLGMRPWTRSSLNNMLNEVSTFATARSGCPDF